MGVQKVGCSVAGLAFALLIGGCEAPDETVLTTDELFRGPARPPELALEDFAILATGAVSIDDDALVTGSIGSYADSGPGHRFGHHNNHRRFKHDRQHHGWSHRHQRRHGHPGFEPFTIIIGENAVVSDPGTIVGERVLLKHDATVGAVRANKLVALRRATFTSRSPFGGLPELPELPDAAPGAQDIDVPAEETLVLSAGRYDALTVTGHIQLTGGTYEFSSIEVAAGATLTALAGSVLMIRDSLDVGSGASLEPLTMHAQDLLIVVQRSDELDDDPPTVDLGASSTLIAVLLAPGADVSVGELATQRGGMIGGEIQVHSGAAQGNPDGGPGLGCYNPERCNTNMCERGSCIANSCLFVPVMENGAPCNHGVCVVQGTRAGCRCEPNWGGPNCDQFLDEDIDGVTDADDNCRNDFNPFQEDSDSDGRGDPCDNCRLSAKNPDQTDVNGNGFGDVCESTIFLQTTDPRSEMTIEVPTRGTVAYAITSGDLDGVADAIGQRIGGQNLAELTPREVANQTVTMYDFGYGVSEVDQGEIPSDVLGGGWVCLPTRYTTIFPDDLVPRTGVGAVDMLHVVRYVHGSCSFRLPLIPLFQEISESFDVFFDRARQAAKEEIGFPVSISVSRDFDIFQPHFRGDLAGGRQMGFFFEGSFRLDVMGINEHLTIDPAYALVPDPTNGRVDVQSLAQNVVVIGGGILGLDIERHIKNPTQDALRDDVPNELEARFASMMDIPLKDVLKLIMPGAGILDPDCNPGAGLEGQQQECFDKTSTLLAAGATNPLSEAAAKAIEPRNFECMENGHCSFHPVVHEVNVLPNDIELVFAPDPNVGIDYLTPFFDLLPPELRDVACSPRPETSGLEEGWIATVKHGEEANRTHCSVVPTPPLCLPFEVLCGGNDCCAIGDCVRGNCCPLGTHGCGNDCCGPGEFCNADNDCEAVPDCGADATAVVCRSHPGSQEQPVLCCPFEGPLCVSCCGDDQCCYDPICSPGF